MKITEPTVVYGMTDAEYHADPVEGLSLSASGAKWLTPPNPCPAKFRHYRDNPVVKDIFDFGHAVHRIVLGAGPEIEVLTDADGVPCESMRTKAAKEADAAARLAGRIPLLATEHDHAQAVAGAVLADPIAGPLFTEGKPEVSMFWPDPETGVIRRGRVDWLRNPVKGKRLLIGDLKTAVSAEPIRFGKSAADLGYCISAANYVDGVIACGLDDDPAFLLAVVEKSEPYVVSTYQVTEDDLQIGRYLMREALRTYGKCVADDHWPGYTSGVQPLELPYYFTRQFEDIA